MLQQKLKELKVAILILSAQCKQPEFTGWHKDDTNREAIAVFEHECSHIGKGR